MRAFWCFACCTCTPTVTPARDTAACTVPEIVLSCGFDLRLHATDNVLHNTIKGHEHGQADAEKFEAHKDEPDSQSIVVRSKRRVKKTVGDLVSWLSKLLHKLVVLHEQCPHDNTDDAAEENNGGKPAEQAPYLQLEILRQPKPAAKYNSVRCGAEDKESYLPPKTMRMKCIGF